ncbi:MAG: hypothetical protein B7Z52_05545 [Burkholderiales bacterium 12-64-5]|nr:MAG: hypothetical protein B7Z52_05545 [Burkholderiales bacterium 12-64-5]
MNIRTQWQPWLLAALLSVVVPVSNVLAAGDPAGDFLSTYAGPHNGDLDVLSADVSFDQAGSQLVFSATFNGAIGTSPDAIYVFGVDRGWGYVGNNVFQSGFPPGGLPTIGSGVTFDVVLILTPGGNGEVTDLFYGGGHALGAGSVTISGNTLTAFAPLSFFEPGIGEPTTWGWNLWPRDINSLANVNVSDFAPDNSDLRITPVPEPETWTLLIAGLLCLGMRRGRTGRDRAS